MKCSICDRPDTRFVYGHYHCHYCEESIRTTIGHLDQEDVEHIILGEDDEDLKLFDVKDVTSD
jgi:hypothetical protein